jgi:hypothetical protein
MWYHGGDLENGERGCDFLFVTDNRSCAEWHAKKPGGKVYRLRPEYDHLVGEYTRDKGMPGFYPKGMVITQQAIEERGGPLAMFEAV